jgi:hypothetical protein
LTCIISERAVVVTSIPGARRVSKEGRRHAA